MRKYLSLLLLVFSSLIAFGDQLVYVNRAWLNGELKEVQKAPYYLGIDPKETGSIDYTYSNVNVPSGKTIRFYAQIPVGYEVTGWAKGTDPYASKTASSATYYDWTYDSATSKLLMVYLDFIKYTINFDANGGSGSMTSQTGISYDTPTYLRANGFSKTGYDFDGWSTGDKQFVNAQQVTGASFGLNYLNKSITLYARWKPRTVTVNLDAQGGSVSQSVTYPTYDAAYSLPIPTKTGTTFVGWYTAKEGGSLVANSGTWKIEYWTTLYARYNTNYYTLTIASPTGDGSGWVNKDPSASSYAYGTKVLLTAVPGEHCKFTSWSDGSIANPRTITMTSNVTLSAAFAKKQWTVRFYYYNAQGNRVYSSQQVVDGEDAVPPGRETIDNYPSHHWTGKWSTTYRTIQRDEDVEAEYDWNSYTISFKAPDRTSGSMSDLKGCLVNARVTLPPNEFIRTGYDFKSWYSAELSRNFEDAATIDALTQENGKTFEFVATWSAKSYTVTLNPNGEEATVDPASVSVVYDGEYGELPTPVREGYTFEGWYTSSYGGDKIEATTKVTRAQDHTLYAHWTAKTYAVTSAGENGGLKGAAVSSGTYGRSLQLSWGSDAEDGYDFNLTAVTIYAGEDATGEQLAQWTSGTSGSYTMSGKYYEQIFVEVKYAKVPREYYLYFNANGGKTPESSRKVKYKTAYGELPVATRTGYDFGGWYSTQTCEGEPVAASTILSEPNNVTVYAKWTVKTYGISTSAVNCKVTAPNKGTFDSALTITWEPGEETGYTFDLKEVAIFAGTTVTDKRLTTFYSGTSASYTMSAEYAENIHIHGEYTKTANKYTVLFDANGGTRCYSQQVTFGGTYGKLPETRQDGYKFLGWFLDGKKIEEDTIVKTADNHTLIAQWEKEVYTIVYHGGEGTLGEMADQVVGIGDTTTLTAVAFTKTGYTFRAWAKSEKDAEAGIIAYYDQAELRRNVYSAGTTVNLYAIWKPNTYTVEFFANGGVGEMELQDFIYDEQQKLSPNEFIRTDYEFLGWATDPAEEYRYEDCALVSNLTYETKCFVKLFAKWGSATIPSNLSKAADCDKTITEGEERRRAITLNRDIESTGSVTNILDETAVGSDAVILAPNDVGEAIMICQDAKGSGILSFKYKANIQNTSRDFFEYTVGYCDESGERQVVTKDVAHVSEDWELTTVEIPKGSTITEINWSMNIRTRGNLNDHVLIDDVKWCPDPWDKGTVALTYLLNDGKTSAPDDIYDNITYNAEAKLAAEDMPVIGEEGFVGWSETPTGAAITGEWTVPAVDTTLYAVWNKVNPIPGSDDRPVIVEGFKFVTDSRFDYVIWTTSDLTVPLNKWEQYGEVITGDGEEVQLPIPPLRSSDGTDLGARFFKVEVIQRGSR